MDVEEFLDLHPPKLTITPVSTVCIKKHRTRPSDPVDVQEWPEFVRAVEHFRLPESLLRQKHHDESAGPSVPAYISNDVTAYRWDASDERGITNYLSDCIIEPLNGFTQHLGWNVQLAVGITAKYHSRWRGDPDVVLHNYRRTFGVGEIKAPWLIRTPPAGQSIVDWWHEDVARRPPVADAAPSEADARYNIVPILAETCHYMAQHERPYGFITNGHVVWFLCRSVTAEGRSLLQISQPIAVDAPAPVTLLRALLYWMTLAHAGDDDEEDDDDADEI